MTYKNKVLSDLVKLRNENVKDNQDSSLVYISTANMNPGKEGVDLQGNDSIGKNGKRFYSDDVLVSNIRPYFKKIWKADRNGVSSADILNFIPIDENLIDRTYLYYLLSNDNFFEYMTVTAKGTKMPRGDKKAIKKYEIPLFTLLEQKEIANLLSSFDNKIENNHAIITNLEEQAQAIFKSWFVDFASFQEEFVESEIGIIPKTWEIKKLSEVFNISYGKNLPTKNLEEKGYPVFGGNGQIGFYHEYLFEKPKIMISCRGAASGKVLVSLPNSFITNNSLIMDEIDESYFYYFKYLFNKMKFENYATGSAQPQITITNIKDIKVGVPEDRKIDKFNKITEPIFKMQLKVQEVNNKLAEIRDTLLPKLMSGEIRVGDIEVEKEAAELNV